jgi:hypothetical protein
MKKKKGYRVSNSVRGFDPIGFPTHRIRMQEFEGMFRDHPMIIEHIHSL